MANPSTEPTCPLGTKFLNVAHGDPSAEGAGVVEVVTSEVTNGFIFKAELEVDKARLGRAKARLRGPIIHMIGAEQVL